MPSTNIVKIYFIRLQLLFSCISSQSFGRKNAAILLRNYQILNMIIFTRKHTLTNTTLFRMCVTRRLDTRTDYPGAVIENIDLAGVIDYASFT